LRPGASTTAEAVEIGASGQAKTLAGPDCINPIHDRRDQGPCGWGIKPAQTDQPIGLPEHRHIPQYRAIAAQGMNACHAVAVADPSPALGVVVGSIEIDKSDRTALITLLQTRHLPSAQGAGTVVEQGQGWLGLRDHGMVRNWHRF